MLVLSRKPNEWIMIGSNIRILVVELDRDQVKLGIEAPPEVAIHRSEVFEQIVRRASVGNTVAEKDTSLDAGDP